MKIAIAMSVTLALAGAAQAQTAVAYWAFPASAPSNNWQLTYPFTADAKANAGPATIDSNAPKWDGTPTGASALQQGSLQLFTGSTINVQTPVATAGQALSLRNDSLDRGQGKSLIIQFDSTNFVDLKLSFADRYSSTGPLTTSVEYSSDGVNYTTFGTINNTRDTTFRLQSFDLSAINSIENLAATFFKITFNSFNAGGSGAARIDNVYVQGTVIPTPGAMALLGLGGLVAGRRRRA